MVVQGNPLFHPSATIYTPPTFKTLNQNKLVMPIMRLQQGAVAKFSSGVDTECSSGARSSRPESEGESISETRSDHCSTKPSIHHSVGLCRESVETSKVRLTNLIESLETTGNQMEVLEKQNIDMEQEVTLLKSRLADEKKTSAFKCLEFRQMHFTRAVFCAWWMAFKEHRYTSELGRLRTEFNQQGAVHESGVSERITTLEGEGESKDKEIVALREELRVEKERHLRSSQRNQTLVKLFESLSDQVKRSNDFAHDLTAEEDDETSSGNVKKLDSDSSDMPVGSYIKDKLHELLAQVDPRYIPRMAGPSVTETCAQQKVVLRSVVDRCSMQMNAKAEGFANAMKLSKPETVQLTAKTEAFIRDSNIEMSPRLWPRSRTLSGFPSVARSLTPQAPRPRQIMTDFTYAPEKPISHDTENGPSSGRLLTTVE